MAALSSLVTSYIHYKTCFICFSFCQNWVTEIEILQVSFFFIPQTAQLLNDTISKGMGQQLFLGAGQILLHMRWLEHMSSLAMQILLAWHSSETPSSHCMDMSKALLTSYLLTAQIPKSYGKETQEAGSKMNNPDQPWALGKWWKWIAVVKNTFLATTFHRVLRAIFFFVCIILYGIVWMSSAQIPSLHQLVQISS